MDKFEKAIKDYGVKAGLTAGVMGLGSVLLFGETVNRNVMGMSVPSYLPIALAGGVSSVLGDLAHDYVLPHIPQNEKLKNIESAGLNFAASGSAFAGSLFLMTGLPSSNLPKAILFGGATKLGTDAVYSTYLSGPNRII